LNRSDKLIAIKPVADPGNSFVRLFSDAIARQGYQIRDFDWNGIAKADVQAAILHWPQELIGFGGIRGVGRYLGFYRRLMDARERGIKIIWVAHNARPHDGGWVSSLLMRRFIRAIDGIIHLSRHSHALIDLLYSPPDRIIQAETVHGHYCDVMQTPLHSAPPVGALVKLAYFGQIRRYKNAELLARIAAELPSEVALTISGRRSHEDVAAQIEQIAAAAPNITLDVRRDSLPDVDLESIVDAADGVVLPYQAILNSGAAIFALSRGRPVLAPKTGSLPELQDAVGEDWIQLYDGSLDATILRNFADWARKRSTRSMPDLAAYSWDRVGRDVAELLDRVIMA
jgi:glycosyltransferase involved in cell wall biosynthesis